MDASEQGSSLAATCSTEGMHDNKSEKRVNSHEYLEGGGAQSKSDNEEGPSSARDENSVKIVLSARVKFELFPKPSVKLILVVFQIATSKTEKRRVEVYSKIKGNTILAILHATTESRAEVKKAYHRCVLRLGSSSRSYAFFIDYSYDTLLFDLTLGCASNAGSLRLFTPLFYPDFSASTSLALNQVENLLISGRYWAKHEIYWETILETTTMAMPALKKSLLGINNPTGLGNTSTF
ncbi:hypothetical protein G7Y89_g1279 [Cudoniella acicularis]|uniref:Uncharacterized protein n=1 Tax=Cudoniella acicularis TaxID=354080 RepID=A0A8H4WAG1_9HELO|nr:hypothetical protein G7Y89_g1279 [Cudoniella acicularis]